MSTQILDTTYRCADDCRFEGCPGHALRLRKHHTSDVWEAVVDGESVVLKDRRFFEALAELIPQ